MSKLFPYLAKVEPLHCVEALAGLPLAFERAERRHVLGLGDLVVGVNGGQVPPKALAAERGPQALPLVERTGAIGGVV